MCTFKIIPMTVGLSKCLLGYTFPLMYKKVIEVNMKTLAAFIARQYN